MGVCARSVNHQNIIVCLDFNFRSDVKQNQEESYESLSLTVLVLLSQGVSIFFVHKATDDG